MSAVFMTGSGSTLVVAGADDAPSFLAAPQYKVRAALQRKTYGRKAFAWGRLCARHDGSYYYYYC